ncbi:MAG TPA: NUDIX hydrolase [Actinomycetota bacterium]|nr:NUDIX hydrolase [Actinomycetota bacterium]
MEPRSSREAFAGRLIRVQVESWDGHDFEVVRHPGAAAVLPVTSEGDVLLVRQFRPAIRRALTEIPAGVLDVDGEDPLGCAARELFEETGYRHRSIEFLGGIYTSAGFVDEYIHLFEAWTGEDQEGSPEDGIEVLRRPLDEMVTAARAGRVRDAKTAVALLLAAARRSFG